MALSPLTHPLTRRRLLCSAATTTIGLLAVACGGTTDTPAPPPATATTMASALPPIPSAAAPPAATAARTITPPLPQAAATAARAATSSAAATPVPTAPFLVFVGSSMTNGTGATGGNTYPQQTIARLQPTMYDTKVFAGGGRSITALSMSAPDQIDPAYAATRSKDILVLETDLTADGGGEKDYADTSAFCTARKAVGWRVVVLTILPRSGARYTWPTFEADRVTMNDTLRANWRGFADALADITVAPQLGTVAATKDPRYFNTDGTHPTDAGYAIMADIVAAAIRTL